METFLLVVRIVLVGIFALAGIGKLLDLEGAKRAVRDFGVPEILARPFAILLPIAELAIAVALLFVQTSWFGAVAGFLLLLIFIAGMAVQMFKGNAPDCHCFGQIHSEPVSPKSIIRNAGFAALALVLVATGRDNQGLSLFESPASVPEGNAMQVIIGLATVALLAAVVYFLKRISEQQTQIMRRIEILELTSTDGTKQVEREDVAPPQSGLTIGSPAPDFVLPDVNDKQISFESLLMGGKPMLFFFVSPTCNPCGALLPEIEKWQDDLKGKLNFVFVSSGTAKDNLEKMGGKNLKQILLQKNREVSELFGAQWTPTAVLINADGSVGSRPAAGDAAIRELVEKIRTSIDEKDLLYIANGNAEKNPLLGEKLPEFELADVSGKTLKSADLAGKNTLITYWGIGCGYCTRMLDDLREWDKTKGQDEPDLLLLSSGDAEKNREMNLQSPIVLDDKREVAQKIGMMGTPSAVLVNREGIIVSEIAVGSVKIWELLGKKK